MILKTIGLVLAVLFSFNVIIFVHELGHFLAARWRGLEVERFQIWFGKPIWKKTINGVQYGLGTIPAGGFVALPQMAPMESIEGSNSERKTPLPPITPLDKIIVAFAGPLFSILLAVFAAVVLWQVGKPKELVDTQTIGFVGKDMPAAEAGILPGDKILKVNGKEVNGFRGSLDSIQESIIFSKGDSVTLTIERPGEGEMEVVSQFYVQEAKSILKRDGVRQIGILPDEPTIIGALFEGGPAEYSGLKVNDQILSIDGVKINSPVQCSTIIRESKDKLLEFRVKRGDEELTIHTKALVPSNGYKLDPDAEPQPMIGMRYKETAKTTELLYPKPWEEIAATSRVLFVTIDRLVASDSGIKVQHLSGPVGIGKMKWHILHGEYPIRRMLYFWVLFNVNLAIFNLLPFPVLDGGHITMAIMEAIRKRPPNMRFLEIIQTSFVLLLFSFLIYVTMKDLTTNFGGGRSESSGDKPEWTQKDLEAAFGK